MSTSFSESFPHLDKKALKRPDGFVTQARNAAGSMSRQSRLWVAGLGTVLAIAAIAGFVSNRRDAKAAKAGETLFQVHKIEQQELAALAPATPAPASTGKEGAAKKAAEAPQKPSVDSLKFDVDAKLSATVKGYRDLIAQLGDTRPGFEARLLLGGLYLNHGEAAKAVPLFEDAGKTAPDAIEKASALSSLGYAHEALGKAPEALAAFEAALAAAPKDHAGLRGDLLLSVARVHEGAKDLARARQAYDRVISELPSSEFAKAAEQSKLQLQ